MNDSAFYCLARGVGFLLLLLLINACSGSAGESRIISATPNATLGTLDLALSLKLNETQLSALDNGIPLVLEFVVKTQGATTQKRLIELSYQPMAKRYQVRAEIGTPRSFSSRLQLLAAMDRVRLPMRATRGANGSVQMRLDTSELPAPMRLPALFDAQWRLFTPPVRWAFGV